MQYVVDVIIVIVILFLAYYISKMVANNGAVTGRGKNITVVEKIAVSKDSTVILLKAAGRLMVVGVTPHGMQTLAELTDEEAGELVTTPAADSFTEVLKRSVDTTLPDGKFKDALERFMNRKGGDGDEKM